MTMNKMITISLCLLIFCLCGNAQTFLDYNKFRSADIFFRHIGENCPQKIGHLKCVNQSNFKHCGKDTNLNVVFYHYSNPPVTYVKFADTFQLHFAVFVQSNISLDYEDFTFNKHTTMEDILSYFHLNQTFIDTTIALRTVLSCSSHKRIYHICLLCNNSMQFNTIDLYFNKRKKLLAIFLPINCQ